VVPQDPAPITATLVAPRPLARFATTPKLAPWADRQSGRMIQGVDTPDPRAPLQLGSRAVLVPVKAFSDAKVRLAAALAPAERAILARSMAERVIAAAQGLPVAVVCDDRDVATWARDLGALVIWEPGQGLNRAVDGGVRRLGGLGVEHVTVAHADLPLATDLSWVGHFAGVTLVPDRQEDGTNVIGVPTGTDFIFSYGPGSFARHVAEAKRSGVPWRVVRAPLLAWDVDSPDDLGVVPLPV
jgi:2-phospho-L-lactate guanylyltransferase